jgi:glycosyltransferase involved in cell wall biosynthesis
VYRFVDFHLATRRCDHIICVSEYTASELRRRFGTSLPPISVVHSGVDPAFSVALSLPELERVVAPFGLTRGEYFLHPGAIDPRKNTGVVLDAFRRYRARGGRLALAVIGLSGPSAALGQYRVGSDPSVRLLPFVSNDVVVALVQAARAVVFVPTEEGFGYPLVEALAAGTPALVSDIAVLREISLGAANMVPPGAPEPLARAMSAYEANAPELDELRRLGRTRAEHFSISNMASQTIDVYEAVARQR